MIITGFVKIGKRGLKLGVYVDDAPWAELDAETVVRERLAKGMALDEARQRQILATDEIVRARKAAAGYNARQPRTRRELERYLTQRRFSVASVTVALEQLATSGTLNDERVIERVVRQRRRKADMGPRRLQAELRGRGIDDKTANREVERALDGVDLVGECAEVASKAARKYQPLSDPKQRVKLQQFLMRRGYESETIREAMLRIVEGADD